MNINTLTIKAQEALQAALNLARERGQQAVEPLHLLAVLIREDDSLATFLLGRVGVNVRGLRDETQRAVGSLPRVEGGGEQFFAQETSKVIQRAVDFTKNFGDKYASVEHLLLGLVAKKLGHAILKSCGLQPLSRAPGSLSRREVNALASALKNWRFAVEGTLPWTQAQVTGGGVPLAEVKTEGCASLRCPGLYLSGEVLDAAGDCGGFNLQWAWATGIAAGRAAARGL